VMLAWGTWLAIALGGVLIVAPLWPRFGLSRLFSPRPTAVVVIAPERDFQILEPLVVIEPPDAVLSPADVEPLDQFSGTSLVPAKAHFSDASAEPWWPHVIIAAWLAPAVAAIAWILAGFAQAWMLVRRSKSAPQWIEEEMKVIATDAVGNALRGV